MESRSVPLCPGLSTAARTFMSASSDAQWQPADLSPEGIAALRADNTEAAASGCSRVREELRPTVESDVVGGVTVQWVCPAEGVDGTEVLLYLYGGAFVVGCPDDDISITARLAHYTRRRVCAPAYRLAPEHPFPAAVEDTNSVYKALLGAGHAVVLVGESAGGNLALQAALHALECSALADPVACVLMSPWIDLTHSGDSHLSLSGLDPTLSVKHFLQPAANVYATQHSCASSCISPLFAPLPAAFPPTYISTATRDLLLSDSTRLAAKLRACSPKVELHVADGLWHVFEWYPDLPEALESVRSMASFINTCLSKRDLR